MTTENKWHSKWWATTIVLPIVVTVSGTGIYDWLKEKPLLTTLLDIAKWAYSLLIAFFNYEIKMWYILIFIFISIVFFYLVSLIKSKPSKTVFEPNWFNYKKDTLKGWLWTWEYERNPLSKKYEISNLIPICKKCDIRMLEDPGFSYRCPKCGETYYSGQGWNWENKQDIEALIVDNIEKEKYH